MIQSEKYSIITIPQKLHLLLHILVHELAHVFVFNFFGPQARTPERGGRRVRTRSGRCYGESGWAAEYAILGGNIIVEWAEGEEWQLGKTPRLLLSGPAARGAVGTGHRYQGL